MGGLPSKGGGRIVRALPRKFVFLLGFEGRNLGCPRNFAGMSRTPEGVQKVCAKKFVLFLTPSFAFRGFPVKRILGVAVKTTTLVHGLLNDPFPKSLFFHLLIPIHIIAISATLFLPFNRLTGAFGRNLTDCQLHNSAAI